MVFRFKLSSEQVKQYLEESFDLPENKSFIDCTISPGPNVRNKYASLKGEFHQWFVDNKIHYTFIYINWFEDHFAYGFYIEIEDDNSAMLFKLTWI